MATKCQKILADSAGWVAAILKALPGFGDGYLYVRRWRQYWITSVLAKRGSFLEQYGGRAQRLQSSFGSSCIELLLATVNLCSVASAEPQREGVACGEYFCVHIHMYMA